MRESLLLWGAAAPTAVLIFTEVPNTAPQLHNQLFENPCQQCDIKRLPLGGVTHLNL